MRPEVIEFKHGLPVNIFARDIEQYPYHWHDVLEIVQVLKGSVQMDIGDENLRLKENDIAIINMGEIHRISKSPENKTLFIQIDPAFYQNLLKEERYLFLYCCSAYYESGVPEKYHKLKEYTTSLIRAYKENFNQRLRKNIESILTDMLHYIIYHFDFLRWGYGDKPFDEKFVERFLQIAERTNMDSEMNTALRDLAKEAGVSFYHLSHDIKKKFGKSFSDLLYYSKCEYAAKLLLSTDHRVIDIALECGFSDVKYLIKHFKHFFQYTPSQFRKLYRADDKALVPLAQYRALSLESINV